MTKSRRRRTERPKGRRVRLNPKRDLAILQALGRMKFLRTTELCRLAFGSNETCVHRMAKLFAAGLVHCFAPALNAENVYSLSSKGKAFLLARTEADADELRTARSLGRTNLTHLGALNDFRISLALACAKTPGIRLGSFLCEWDLKSEGPPQRGQYVPDAICSLEPTDGREVVYAVEVDLGGEPARYVGERKVRPVVIFHHARGELYGFRTPRLLLLARGPRRLVQLAWAALDEGGNEVTLLGDLDALDESNVLRASFATPKDLGQNAEQAMARAFFWSRKLVEGRLAR